MLLKFDSPISISVKSHEKNDHSDLLGNLNSCERKFSEYKEQKMTEYNQETAANISVNSRRPKKNKKVAPEHSMIDTLALF